MKVRKAIENVTAYPIKSTLRRGSIRLDLNESTRGCSPKVLAALQKMTWEDVGAYPEYPELKAKTAAILGVSPEKLLFTNGADDAIRSLMQTYIDPGDEVVLADPTFGIIPIHASVMSATLRSVAYQPDFAFPMDGYLQAISQKTKLVSILRPDSPTGAVINPDQLRELLLAAPDALVMLDETYHHFLDESLVQWVDEFPNLVVLHSFSKAYCLAGIRCGLIIANTPVIDEVRKVDPPFSLSSPGVIAIGAALDDPEHVQWVVEDVRTEKRRLIAQLEAFGWKTHDTDANFILVNFGTAAASITEKLAENRILIKNLSGIPLLRGWCRIAIGTRDEHQQLFDVLPTIR